MSIYPTFIKRYALTLGEASIADVSEILEHQIIKAGFSVECLHKISQKLQKKYPGLKNKMYDLSSILPEEIQ